MYPIAIRYFPWWEDPTFYLNAVLHQALNGRNGVHPGHGLHQCPSETCTFKGKFTRGSFSDMILVIYVDDVLMGCQHVPTLAPADVVSTEQELCLRGVGPWNAWWHQPPVRFSSRSSAAAWASFFIWEFHPNIYKKSWKILGPPKKLTVGHQKSNSSKENVLPIVNFQVPCSTFGAYSFLHRVEFWMSIWILL